ncbi:MAG: T9SS type A sorting domain-containing protein [Bacteroidetes bacterium]|nr:T9SS type A sorting domain-containing protein [Bacteroidota bacterium]
MKKILFMIFMSLGMFYTILAQGVYNGDFEAWENKVFYEDPLGYSTANSQFFMIGGTPNVTKSTDAYDGMYSLRMETSVFAEDTLFGFAIYGLADDNGFGGGFPFTEMPDSIKGFFKYHTANNDSALILVLQKKNGFPISMEFIPFYGVQNTWTELAFKMTPVGQAPDTIIIGFASSNPDNNTINPGNWLMVDHISFTNTTSTIPNSSFENWLTLQAEEPLGWNTFNLFFLLDGKQPNVTRSSDAYKGNSSISIKTSSLSFFGGELDTFGIATTGMIGDFGFAGGFPMKNKPDSLSFYYKYNNSNNILDLAVIYVAFSKYDAGMQQSVTIDSALSFLPGSFNWSRKSFAFNPASGIPDTSNILLTSSNLFFGTNSGVGNELIVDEMIYWYGTVGVPVINDQLNTIFAYPNPARETINMDIDFNSNLDKDLYISIFDLKGKLVYQRNITSLSMGKQKITTDVSFLPAATYLISISDGGENGFTTQFIKE